MKTRATAILAGMTLVILPAVGQSEFERETEHEATTTESTTTEATGVTAAEANGPMKQVSEAAAVIKEIQGNQDANGLLQKAKGVLIIPNHVTVALIAGGSGGEGVMLMREGNSWGNPAFYNLGGVSIGAQAGAAAGSIAMFLMTDKAFDRFKDNNNFELTAEAGLSVVNWSAKAQGEIGEGNDVIMWSATEGLLAEASLGVKNISWDEADNAAYYGRNVTAADLFGGRVENPHKQMLQQTLGRE